MSQPDPRADVARRPLLLNVDGTGGVTATHDLPYRSGDDGLFDLYRGGTTAAPRPAVVFVTGYPDAGMRRFVGCAAKEMESYITWARALAACGVIGVTYTNVEPLPDLSLLLQHLRQHADAYAIDARRLAIWSCSGNVPAALGALMSGGDGRVAAAVFCYPYTMDLDGSTAVAEAAAAFRFTNGAAGRTIDDLPEALPICLVRAGADTMPRLNESLDRFAARLLAADRPLTLINAAAAPHAFDTTSDTSATRAALRQVLAFVRGHLLDDTAAASLP